MKKVQIDVVYVYITSLILLIVMTVAIVTDHYFLTLSDTASKEVSSQIKKETEEYIFFNPQAFEGVTVEAKAYIVYDIVGKRVVASKNEEERLPLASITKVMTSLTALSLLVNKEEIFQIEQNQIEDGFDLGLKKDQKWHLDELLKYMLVFSSNDAALVIASHFGGRNTFVNAMNSLSQKYGLTATFSDPAGRDEGGAIGGIGTAKDAALLFVIAMKEAPDLLDATTKKRQSVYPLSGKLTGVPNTNQSIQTLPGAEGSKTGYTDLAGGNLGVVVDVSLGRPVVLVVLGSTKEGRFRDIDVLYKALQKSLAPVPTGEE